MVAFDAHLEDGGVIDEVIADGEYHDGVMEDPSPLSKGPAGQRRLTGSPPSPASFHSFLAGPFARRLRRPPRTPPRNARTSLYPTSGPLRSILSTSRPSAKPTSARKSGTEADDSAHYKAQIGLWLLINGGHTALSKRRRSAALPESSGYPLQAEKLSLSIQNTPNKNF